MALTTRLRGKSGGGEGGFKVLIVILVIVAAIVIVNNLYLGYKTVPIDQNGVSCEDGVFRATAPVNTATLCDEYMTSRCVFKCDDGEPICKCESSVFNQMFMAPGDYPH